MSEEVAADQGLGPALRRARIRYQLRLAEELGAAGFDDVRFPGGRVLRVCARSGGATISQIGRELGITRQGAGKVVGNLRDRGYVSLRASPTDGREKIVEVTARTLEFAVARRRAVRRVERELRDEIGPDAFDRLLTLLTALGGQEGPPTRDLRRRGWDSSLLAAFED
ncbi:MAG: MarR family winged helix-turn-helix transcriptional regulator [Candidatus Dormibacteraceae bacterium]